MTRLEARLWLAQRATAVILAACVAVHLATMVMAVRGGLDAEHILARTRGSLAVATFYGVFVVAAAIHGAIGLRTVAREWLRWERGVGAAAAVVALALAAFGMRAVVAVVMP